MLRVDILVDGEANAAVIDAVAQALAAVLAPD